MLLAVPIFLLLIFSDSNRQAIIQIRNGLFIAAGGALLLKQMPFFVFGITLVPVGYSLYRSITAQESPALAGGKGVVVLAVSWLLFWVITGTISGVNPYVSLLASLDKAFAGILEIYRQNAELPPDVIYGLEQLIGKIRQIMPRILPGMLAGSLLFTVWLNMVIGNRMAIRLKPEIPSWPKYSLWQLPDKLVWLPIIAVILALTGTGNIQNAGFCLGIISSIIYLFQGLSLFIFFLDKWNVPGLLRYLIYGILIVQSYALLMLCIIGLADTWCNFRKLHRNEQINNAL